MTPGLEANMHVLTVCDASFDGVGANESYVVSDDDDSSSDSGSEDSIGLETRILDDSNDDEQCDIAIIARDVSTLFKQNQFFGVLTLVPTLHKFHVLPSSMRIIIALTLFILGRVGGALREVSLAIEMESDPSDRERYIQCLVCFFQQLEMPDRAYACFEEIIDIATAEQIISKDDRAKVKTLEEKIKKYKVQLNECLSITAKAGYLVTMQAMKLDEQAQNYLDSDGNLDHFSLGRICISTKSKLEEAQTLLQSWDNVCVIKGRKNPIQLMFNEIMKLAPLYLYQTLRDHEDLICRYLSFEFKSNTGVEYDADSDSILAALSDPLTNKPGTRVSMYVMIVNHKVILGFLEFLNHNYTNAIAHFEWVLQFFDTKLKGISTIAEKNATLSSVTQSVVTVLLCQCYDFGTISCDNNRLNELFLSFVNATRIRSKSEYSCGRLAVYFISFGLLHEFGATNEASKIIIENDNNEVVAIAYRLEQSNLEEMIRKYILAVTSKAHDDPSTNILYDRIIWGILLCGGIHLKTLWFFILVKNYFFIESDFGPLHIFPELGFRIFSTDDILSQYENAWELIDKIYNLYNTLSSSEKQTIWDPENGNLFLTPQIFDAGDKLFLTDSFYDENLRNSSSSFILDSQYQVRQKLKGHIKLQGRLISSRIDLSKDLISLWYNTYEECHGSVPSAVADFLIDD